MPDSSTVFKTLQHWREIADCRNAKSKGPQRKAQKSKIDLFLFPFFRLSFWVQVRASNIWGAISP